MKKILMMVVAMALVFAFGAVAMAADNTAKVLGTWEVEFPGYGVFQVEMKSDATGTVSQDGQVTEQFSFAMRDDFFAGNEMGEDGVMGVEVGKLEFPDADTIVMKEGDTEVTYKRLAPADAEAMNVSNAFLGTWVGDIPEAEGMAITYKADGTCTFKSAEYEGESSYFVWENSLFMLTDEGETEVFTFVSVDEENMDVTEVSTGEVVRFVRQTADLTDVLSVLDGTYTELFTVICAPEYDQTWLDACAEIVDADQVEATAAMLKSACIGTVYGEEAIAAYESNPESIQFNCSFIGGVAQFTVEGNTITGTDKDGAIVFSHTYNYKGQDSSFGMDMAIYESADADSGEFTYFLFAPDSADETYHIEFRYGDNLDDLNKMREGKYAYWLAAGIPTTDTANYAVKAIELFCEENIPEVDEAA